MDDEKCKLFESDLLLKFSEQQQVPLLIGWGTKTGATGQERKVLLRVVFEVVVAGARTALSSVKSAGVAN